MAEKNITAKVDADDHKRPGWKFAEWELKGVPVRLAVGPKDMANRQVEVFRRDIQEKKSTGVDEFIQQVPHLMEDIQKSLYQRALKRMQEKMIQVNNYQEFQKLLDTTGGFLYAHWDGTPETEARIKEETKATIRCIPLNQPAEEGKCILTGKPSKRRVLFARAY